MDENVKKELKDLIENIEKLEKEKKENSNKDVEKSIIIRVKKLEERKKELLEIELENVNNKQKSLENEMLKEKDEYLKKIDKYQASIKRNEEEIEANKENTSYNKIGTLNIIAFLKSDIAKFNKELKESEEIFNEKSANLEKEFKEELTIIGINPEELEESHEIHEKEEIQEKEEIMTQEQIDRIIDLGGLDVEANRKDREETQEREEIQDREETQEREEIQEKEEIMTQEQIDRIIDLGGLDVEANRKDREETEKKKIQEKPIKTPEVKKYLPAVVDSKKMSELANIKRQKLREEFEKDKEYYRQDMIDKMYGNAEKQERYKLYLKILEKSIVDIEFNPRDYDGSYIMENGEMKKGKYQTVDYEKMQKLLDKNDSIVLSVDDCLKLLQLEEYKEKLENVTKFENGDNFFFNEYLQDDRLIGTKPEEITNKVIELFKEDKEYVETKHLASNYHEHKYKAIRDAGGLVEYKNDYLKVSEQAGFGKVGALWHNTKSLLGIKPLEGNGIQKISIAGINTLLIASSPVALPTKLLYRYTPVIGKNAQSKRYLEKYGNKNSSPYDGKKDARKMARREYYKENSKGIFRNARAFGKATIDDIPLIGNETRREDTENAIMDKHYEENILESLKDKYRRYDVNNITTVLGADRKTLEREGVLPPKSVVNTDAVGRKNREKAVYASTKRNNYIPYTALSIAVGLGSKEALSRISNKMFNSDQVPTNEVTESVVTERKLVGYEEVDTGNVTTEVTGIPETAEEFAKVTDNVNGTVNVSVNGGEVPGWEGYNLSDLNTTNGVAFKIQTPDGQIIEDEFASAFGDGNFEYLGDLVNGDTFTPEQYAQYIDANGNIKSDANIFEMISDVLENKHNIDMSAEDIKLNIASSDEANVYLQQVTKENGKYGGWVDITSGQDVQITETPIFTQNAIYENVEKVVTQNVENVVTTDNTIVSGLRDALIAAGLANVEPIISGATEKNSKESGAEQYKKIKFRESIIVPEQERIEQGNNDTVNRVEQIIDQEEHKRAEDVKKIIVQKDDDEYSR